jgi:hypothetical protein
LRTAAAAAYDAVAEPVEGTVLTVARAAADAAWELGSDDLADVCTVAARSAAQALARTPEQLPALARAGVVDAGGRGLVVLLDALAGVATGSTPTLPLAPAPAPLVADRETGSDAYSYEVQYLLAAPDAALGPLRVELGALGDSLVVVGDGDGMWNVHVHVDDVGAAIEAGIRAGRPSRIGVTRYRRGRPRTGWRARPPPPWPAASWSWSRGPGSPSCSPPRAPPWWTAARPRTRAPPRC